MELFKSKEADYRDRKESVAILIHDAQWEMSRNPGAAKDIILCLYKTANQNKDDGLIEKCNRLLNILNSPRYYEPYEGECQYGGDVQNRPSVHKMNMMSAASLSPTQKSKTDKSKAKIERKFNGKPMTLRYFTHGNNGKLMRQRKSVHQVFNMWNRWGWIDEQTTIEDFDAFFEGVPRHCNITWTGSNTTILTILLQNLLGQSYIERQTRCSAKSLVMQQFGKTANSDRKRLDPDDENRIKLTLFVLDPKNHDLIFQSSDDLSEIQDIQDSALQEIFAGKLRSTKGI